MHQKLFNTGAGIALAVFLLYYIVYSLVKEITGECLDIIYALSGHVAIFISALVFRLNSTNKYVNILAVYTFMFFFISTLAFVIVGLWMNQHYFSHKLCLLLSIPLTLLYEIVSYFDRKYKISDRIIAFLACARIHVYFKVFKKRFVED